MTKKRRPKRRPGGLNGSDMYAKEIIKCLARVGTLSGQRPSIIFNDWIIMVEATLERLPEHIKAVAQTGQFAPDTAAVAELVAQIHSRYRDHGGDDKLAAVWTEFGRAFALLLEAAEPGLWCRENFNDGYMGPDIVGHVYMLYANSDPSWNAQHFTSWDAALLMAIVNVGDDGKAEVQKHLKQALYHEKNMLGPVVLLAGQVKDDSRHDWFLNRVIPTALPYYDPVTVCDPAVGSGVLLLAAASQYEPWMVPLNLVQFFGQDNDLICIRMCQINMMLYGLNGYSLRLAVAAANSSQGDAPPPLLSAGETLKAAKNVHRQTNGDQPPVTEPTFEQLFRKPAEEVSD